MPPPLEEVIDRSYVIYAGILVFFMQAGFTMFEAGSVRVKNTAGILLKNTMDLCLCGVVFYFIGYGFSYGDDSYGQNDFIGVGNFMLFEMDRFENFFFQWGFVSATSTIVSGCIAERTKFLGYFAAVFAIASFVYPVVAHWVWSSDGWLADLGDDGYLDFAGSGVVHTLGGIFGAVGAAMVGPRMGRFENGKPQPIAGHSTVLETLGTFFLWFGWYGFNPGSTLGVSDGRFDIAGKVATNTTLSAAAAVAACFLFRPLRLMKGWDISEFLACALSGLVGITGGCAFVEPWAAVIIGVVSAFAYYGSTAFLLKLRVDDPIRAFSVHAGAGIWGQIATALFFTSNNHDAVFGGNVSHQGLFITGDANQLWVQVVGTIAIVAWAAGTGAVVFGILKVVNLLRVSPESEKKGVDYKATDPTRDCTVTCYVMDNGKLDSYSFKQQTAI